MEFKLKILLIAVYFLKSEALSLDNIVFGNAESEKNHNFSGTQSVIITGGLGESARKLNPLSPPSWYGHSLYFDLKVDEKLQTYFTLRLWGNDVSENLLVLYIEGKQVGCLHLGDIDILNHGTNGDEKFYDRFQYFTSPLPISVTKDCSFARFEIRPFGRIWGYGTTFDEYQKNMTEQTRGIYSAYTHTDGFFEPSSQEKQGNEPTFTTRNESATEVIDKLKTRVNKTVNELLNSKTPFGQMHIQFLSKAYYVKWTAAYNNTKAIDQVIASIDHIYTLYVNDSKFIEYATDTWNPEWFGVGPCGDAIWTLSDEIRPNLTQQIDNGLGNKIQRSTAWIDMLKASRDYHLKNRRQYTNQGMITDLYIYLANKGIQHINRSFALSEQKTLSLLYESVGITPWLGSMNDKGEFTNPFNSSFYQITEKGLTRELGFVGYYGEVLDWVAMIYDATRPKLGQIGDQKIAKQFEKIIQARGVFRYPELDKHGYKAMIIETIVGWRDTSYPGGVVYAERNSWDGTAILAPSRILDSVSVGYVQQMIGDNQFYETVEQKMQDSSFRVTAALLTLPDDYDTIRDQPNSTNACFPMTQSEYVFSDPEDGVVAVKHNHTILYASLYWRARFAINNLARVHYITPTIDRIAVVYEKTNFTDSGFTYTRPDWTNFGFGNGGLKYPADIHSANAGEKLPVPQIAVDNLVRIGDESIYAGRSDFYQLQYGKFLIGMNTHRTKSYDLVIPTGVSSAIDLASKTKLQLSSTLNVKPFSTQILYIN